MSLPEPTNAVSQFMAALKDGSFYEDSAPAWAALRQAAPMVKMPFGDYHVWVCTTWRGCATLARDPRMSAARTRRYASVLPPESRHKAQPFVDLLSEWVLFLDPPRHTQVRKLLNRGFTPETIARNRPRIGQLFDGLLDQWITSGKGDIMGSLIHPFPALVIADWMGLPKEKWTQFMEWADALIRVVAAALTGGDVETVSQWLALVEENRAYLDEVVRNRQPGRDDLLGLLTQMEEGEVLDHAQLVAQAVMILFAGHETTRNLIGGGLHWLLSNTCNYGEFLGDDVAQRLAVDEILRLSSPVMMTGRMVADDFEFEGVSLVKGDYVQLAWASANRDPEQFPKPDRVDLKRRNNPHLAFGAGPHACLGLHLARVEAQVAFERLWTKLPNLRLAERRPEWYQSVVIHGPVELYVEY
jgi:cytochrome P450